MAEPGFWDDQAAAQTVIRRNKTLHAAVDPLLDIEARTRDLSGLIELAAEEGDDSFAAEIDGELSRIDADLEQLEIQSLLSGEFDSGNAYLSIHPGAGGTESCDWGAMLLRMYERWAEGRGYGWRLLELQPGDEAGIKSATMELTGPYVYGYLKSECGVHRLVRISPFDSQSRRHTSFTSVDVYPEVSDDVEVEIDEKDLRIDTYRSSGAGGQHVNVTDSAVRITHEPTGIVVACQDERSQHKNRASAMKVLRARLYEHYRRQREEELAAKMGKKSSIEWGSQIRSYVLHPYQMVKDHRTEVSIGNAQAVLDGALDELMGAYLRVRK